MKEINYLELFNLLARISFLTFEKTFWKSILILTLQQVPEIAETRNQVEQTSVQNFIGNSLVFKVVKQ